MNGLVSLPANTPYVPRPRLLGTSEPVELVPTKCSNKRGVAFGFQETDDLYTLKDGISWWYD